jgi:L-ascorbate metabolism protein UlaG (beta-lactamase superfamily)
MNITWLGHSCFLLDSGGYRVVLDPYCMDTYPPLRVDADEILCSHDHRDHNFTEGVTLSGRGRTDSPFAVETLETFHDEARGAKRGRNTIRILRAEGLTVVHCGDLGHALDGAQLAALRGCDALLLPVGGYYTIDAQTAKAVADAVAPRVVVPMHYRFGAHGYAEIGTAEEFLALYDGARVRRLGENSFTLTKDAPAGVLVPRFAE